MARAGALRLPDELFDQSYRVPKPEETVRYLINEFEPAFDAADFSRCGRDLFVTPQRRDERAQDCWLRRQPRRSGLAHPRGREPMQPAHVYGHHFCAIGAGQGAGKAGAGSLPADASARVEGFLAYGPFAGAFRCATLDTRRRGALEDYFLVVAQPARDAGHQAIQVIGGPLRQRGLP
jgi:hypothetical protein